MFIFEQVALGHELRADWCKEAWNVLECFNREAYACFAWGC